jgi:uncharacterized membrane protein
MQVAQWILLIVGVVLILWGAGLMTWASVQRSAHAGVIADAATLAEKVAKLFDAMGRYFGPDPAMKTGGFLVVVGVVLVALALFVV